MNFPEKPLSSSVPSFPANFIWGAATASHQVEGGNYNNDVWLFEHVSGTQYVEPSVDAIDHYHRYREDIKLLADLGLGAYRFSLEWSRIEPEKGFFSKAAIEHYRRVLTACHTCGLIPIVTYHHFTSPTWLLKEGGWESENTPQLFARYCKYVTEELGDLFDYACTLNEANLAVLLTEYGFVEKTAAQRANNPMWQSVAKQLGISVEQVAGFQLSGTERAEQIKCEAHRAAFSAIKGVRPAIKVGWTLANADIQPVDGGEQYATDLRQRNNLRYLEVSKEDDFVGIQTYNRVQVGAEGMVGPQPGAELNQAGEEIWPWSIGNTIREAAQYGIPVLVTENGLNTHDDKQRVQFIKTAVSEVGKAIADGVEVLGYIYWSAFDNFEWIFGYDPHFGIIGVDRNSQERIIRPSARYLGEIARSNGAILK